MINKSIVLFVPNGLTFHKNSVIVKYTDEFNELMRTQKKYLPLFEWRILRNQDL